MSRINEPHKYQPDVWMSRFGLDPHWCVCDRRSTHPIHIDVAHQIERARQMATAGDP